MSSEQLAHVNAALSPLSAQQRVSWALDTLPDTHVISSSFGVQSAVMLHLLSSQRPDIPVLVIDTGYLFPETYQFIDTLQQRLHLNLRVLRADTSPAWQEAKFGKLWEQGADGLAHYNTLNKVEPMQRALDELQVGTWFSGLRRVQAKSRETRDILEVQGSRMKVHPIIDWTDHDIYLYLKEHDLPYHPLWEEGYISVGDVHTTRKFEPGMNVEDTRFFGMDRECGLHVKVQ
ncbi:MAG: phosphoadenylyl-sulfate reductase [Pseudomonadota bacterium]